VKNLLLALGITLVGSTGCVGFENSQLSLRSAIDAQPTQAKLHRCYSQALVNDGDVEGSLSVVVRVSKNADGKIDMVEPTGVSQLTNPDLHGALHRCVQRALIGLPAGQPVQGDLYVLYTFNFQPEAERSSMR
jgi:hypothetical protein